MEKESEASLKPPTQRSKTISEEGDPALAALEQRNRILLLLNRAGQVLTETLEMREVLERLLQVTIEIIGAEGSSVWLWDEEKRESLVCRAAFHQQYDPPLVDQRLSPGQGVAGWVAQTGESAVVPLAAEDPRFFPDVDARSDFTTRSLLVVPLRLRDAVIGVLEVVNKIEGSFTPDDLAVAEALAPSASIAIDNARLVETLHQRTKDLQAQNEELDAYAHTVAHDLQNPLALITGFADMLERSDATKTGLERKQILQMLASNVRKMSNIVQELLLLSSVRQMEVEVQPLEMDSIVASARGRLMYLLDEHNAELILPDTWPAVLGYAPWVEEVWENYLSNAIKYGGDPPRIELGGELLPDGSARFWVRDNGPGLTPEAQAQLFTPFTKLDEVRATGYGLGLSIVRRIMEKLGGTVGVESEGEQGSVFSFTLPGVNREIGDFSTRP